MADEPKAIRDPKTGKVVGWGRAKGQVEKKAAGNFRDVSGLRAAAAKRNRDLAAQGKAAKTLAEDEEDENTEEAGPPRHLIMPPPRSR